MSRNFFVNVTANVLLAAAVVTVFAVGLGGASRDAFLEDKLQPVYRGNPDRKYVSLMFNVYWGTEYLPEILEILEKYEISTTFFVGGYWVAQNTDLLKEIADRGHEIGNHGFYHKDQGKLSYEKNVSEIVNSHKLIEQTTGVSPVLFAPPSGDFSSNTLQAAYDNGYTTIMWSRDTVDWRDKDADLVFRRATENTSNGELILMHPTAHTLKALERIIQYYKAGGFEIVTVSRNIA